MPFFFKTPSLVEPRRTIRIVKRQRALLTTSLLTLIAVKRQFPGKIAQYDVSVLTAEHSSQSGAITFHVVIKRFNFGF